MKTITSCVLVVVAAASAACATHEPATSSAASHTLPALPQPQTYSPAQLTALRKTPGGNYPGYQRIMVDGQTRYCRRSRVTGSNTESKVVCVTEAQIWSEQLRAQQLASVIEDDSRRSGTAQIENQEAARQLIQNIAANNPVTVVPMTAPMSHP